MIEHHRRIVDWLEQQGATEVRVELRKHAHIRYVWRGKAGSYVTSATPSDRRASANAISNLRHILGLIETTRRVGQRRHASRPSAPRPCRAAAPVLTVGLDWRSALAGFRPAHRPLWRRLALAFRRYIDATGIEAEGQDAQRLGAKPESPAGAAGSPRATP